ncbi:hypothetical protein [Devosia sp.]|uniref:hypothetical protein n=1 Tax=Devosia sp. TaxID=1871048 RepID=UPI002733ACA8|nr:hypothetical protein [Devosia sp.]MDP2779848.1 hypothetical protein [Devosia sp.]
MNNQSNTTSKRSRQDRVTIPASDLLDILDRISEGRRLAEACCQLGVAGDADVAIISAVGQAADAALEAAYETADTHRLARVKGGDTPSVKASGPNVYDVADADLGAMSPLLLAALYDMLHGQYNLAIAMTSQPRCNLDGEFAGYNAAGVAIESFSNFLFDYMCKVIDAAREYCCEDIVEVDIRARLLLRYEVEYDEELVTFLARTSDSIVRTCGRAEVR